MHFNSRLFIYPYIHGCFPVILRKKETNALSLANPSACAISLLRYFSPKVQQILLIATAAATAGSSYRFPAGKSALSSFPAPQRDASSLLRRQYP